MGMDMDVIVMNKAAGLCLFLSAFTLAGCVKTPSVTAEIAQEVALDEAGYEADQVKNLQALPQDHNFVVSFDTPAGAFTYVISEAGLIKDRSFTLPSQSSTSTQSTSRTSSSASESSASQSEWTEQEQNSINAALANIGIEPKDVENLDVVQDGGLHLVTFRYNNANYQVQVDPKDGKVLSTLF